MFKRLFYFGLGSVLVGGYFYYKRQLDLLYKIGYKVKKIRLVEVAPLKLLVTTELTNNSEVSFTIQSYAIKVFINGKEVGIAQNKDINKKLNAFGGKTTIQFYTTFNPNEVGLGSASQGAGLGSLLSGVLDTFGETDIAFKGKISVKRGFFEFANYPVDFSYKLKEFL